MRPVSAAFLRTIRGSHQAVARATVCTTFKTGTTPSGIIIPILEGDVEIDGSGDTPSIRSSLDMTTDGAGMWPALTTDTLAPYGNEVYVERGVVLSDASVEWVGLGFFRIDEPEQSNIEDGPIRLTCPDRMAGIIDARLLDIRQYNSGASLGFIVTDLVTEVYPSAVVVWDDATSAVVITRSLVVDEDRFGFLDDLVRSAGKIWYWDHIGQLQITTPPNPGSPVFEVSSGTGGVLVSLSRKLSRNGVYNAVVASGDAAGDLPPARGVAFDNNPSSPTYFSGRFGPVPRFYSSPFITTVGQAQSAASAILLQNLGLSYSVDFEAAPNPALQPYDPVLITYPSGATETHVLSKVTVPLTGDALKATTRDQTVILIGTA